MNCMPAQGRVACVECFDERGKLAFDVTQREEGNWRITWNPLAWGAVEPEVVVLGFSKGPTQAGALAKTPHELIAYKGKRHNVGRILRHIGLLPVLADEDIAGAVDSLIADPSGRFHFGSLIRCTVEQHDSNRWIGSGGGMLDRFVATQFGREIATNCATRFLSCLPGRTRLIVMFGMGSGLGYVRHAFELISAVRGGAWRWISDVAYTDGKVTVVHVEHFASQGALIPQWLGKGGHPRGRYGDMARAAVRAAGIGSITHEAPQPTAVTDSAREDSAQATWTAGAAVPQTNTSMVPGAKLWIAVTGGNIRNGHFYIARQGSPFPSDVWGGTNRAETARQVLVRFTGTDETVRTDIDGSKRILRDARGHIRRFFEHHRLEAGDRIQIARLRADLFEVSPVD